MITSSQTLTSDNGLVYVLETFTSDGELLTDYVWQSETTITEILTVSLSDSTQAETDTTSTEARPGSLALSTSSASSLSKTANSTPNDSNSQQSTGVATTSSAAVSTVTVSSSSSNSDDSPSEATRFAAAAGTILLAAIIVAVTCCCYYRRRRGRGKGKDSDTSAQTEDAEQGRVDELDGREILECHSQGLVEADASYCVGAGSDGTHESIVEHAQDNRAKIKTSPESSDVTVIDSSRLRVDRISSSAGGTETQKASSDDIIEAVASK